MNIKEAFAKLKASNQPKQYVGDKELDQYLRENPEILEIFRTMFSIQFHTALWITSILVGIFALMLTLLRYSVGLIGAEQLMWDLLFCAAIFVFSSYLASAMQWVILKVEPRKSKDVPPFLKILRGEFQ